MSTESETKPGASSRGASCSPPKVSVIMGAYNENDEKKVRRSLDSIAAQTFTDWELIVCDDGSTDGTWELLTRLTAELRRHYVGARHDGVDHDDSCSGRPKVTLLRNGHNRGLAFSLNRCVEQAQGEYLARQDFDDYSDPSRFALQAQFLDDHPEYSFVGSNRRFFDDEGLWGEQSFPERPEKKDFLKNSCFVHPSVMMRKTDLEKAGKYAVAKATRRAEDYELFMRMYAMGMCGYNLQVFLLNYYEGRSSYGKRKFRYRIDEMIVRYNGFRALGLFPRAIAYVFRPLVVGLVPRFIYSAHRKRQFGKA